MEKSPTSGRTYSIDATVTASVETRLGLSFVPKPFQPLTYCQSKGYGFNLMK
jgi:hypothetical protein